MYIFLLYFSLSMVITNSRILIRDCGVEPTETNDMSLVFYCTLYNSCGSDANIAVSTIKCQENVQPANSANHMCLIGGDMGVLKSKYTKNVTLLYPNLYVCGRTGSCLISITYQTSEIQEILQKEVAFNTQKFCSQDCGGSDCVAKYSSTRNYYSKSNGLCYPVTDCPYDAVYIPKSNRCRNLKTPVCRDDLQLLEEEHYEKCYYNNDLINFICHHGNVDNKTGECICDDGWTTTTCADGMYQPSLAVYHMCNIELSSWEEANRQKLLMTILAVAILALAIAAKMLIVVCILNWCCNWIRSKRSNDGGGKSICNIYQSPYMTCTEDVCVAGEDARDLDNLKCSRSNRVSFSDIDAISTGDTENTENTDNTDISMSMSGDQTSASERSIGEDSLASGLSCNCSEKQ